MFVYDHWRHDWLENQELIGKAKETPDEEFALLFRKAVDAEHILLWRVVATLGNMPSGSADFKDVLRACRFACGKENSP